jgi:hypothetical protein
MRSSSAQDGSSARRVQWWCVLALFVGAAGLASLGVLTLLAPCMAAVAAVWGAVLLATKPWVVRRIPNTRGAIVLTGIVVAVGLTMYAYNAAQSKGNAHAMESAVPPATQAAPAAPDAPHPDSGSY